MRISRPTTIIADQRADAARASSMPAEMIG